jgi:hypothetical protein
VTRGANRSWPVVVLTVLGIGVALDPTFAYLKFGTVVDGRAIELHWPSSVVRYFVHDDGTEDVSPDQLAAAVGQAFDAWAAVPTSSVRFERVGFTGATPLDEDGASTLGFSDAPEMDRTLAATSYLIDVRTGEILESDIFFNSAFPWSTAADGEPGRYDLQSIATHEIGHFLGLGHSAIGETELQESGGSRRLISSGSVMFPIAFAPGNLVDRRLTADDVAGVSDIYPTGDFVRSTGSLQGRVLKGGQGVFGAHVTAFDLGEDGLVGNFTLDDDGGFVIAGLRPGTYVVRVEPLDDGDVESFFDEAGRVDTDFRVSYYPGLVTVPRGGASTRITVEVQPK